MHATHTLESAWSIELGEISLCWSAAEVGLECRIVAILAEAFEQDLDRYSNLEGSCARVALHVADLLERRLGSGHFVRICGGSPCHYFCEVDGLVVDTAIGQFFNNREHAPRVFTGTREALVEWLRPYWEQRLLTAECYQKAKDIECFVANQWGRHSSEDDPVLFIARGLEV